MLTNDMKFSLLSQYGVEADCDVAQARARAETLHADGFGVADAAHVAYAEAMADVFLSCDDKLLKKCRKTPLQVAVMNPIVFCAQEELT
jgi:hypothetical protein